ncbi:MAG: phosphoribosyltransferase [Phycisphaerales bacterium]|nr:phosphoribosyltransferase [Phycisphaerales bacterium]
MSLLFHDRIDAGRQLAARLARYAHGSGVLVLGLPRGGIPVAYEVARALDVPLDVFVVRKLGVPGHEELAMGAIASGNAQILNDDVIRQLHIPQSTVDQVAARERAELVRCERAYRLKRSAMDVANRIVILVDDGLATGASMRAAVLAVKQMGPAGVVIAVPVAAAETCELMRRFVDEVICVYMPESFQAVGLWYEDFEQTSDEEVRRLLIASRARER